MKTTEGRSGQKPPDAVPPRFEISDEDIHEAMKEISGYLDITAADFRELYRYSFRHALDRLINSVRVGDIMTRAVVTVELATPLHEVADRMASAGVSGLPVLDGAGRVAGIISERDFLRHMGTAGASFMSIVAACLRGQGCAAVGIRKGTAADIMNSPVISVGEAATLGEAAALLTQRGINRVPVLGREGELLGILTRSDLVKAHVFG
ncbi:MAG: CBS domain-containing protein [Desulfobulbaceae bacterium]|jgi:CBS-domain-containing membrane protein|nr:CBS domain-containing protein [Desulfobulbaceae bacterium]MDY0352022.1 CBS domain-containing protein [Desulfobulbaceae bacterium]